MTSPRRRSRSRSRDKQRFKNGSRSSRHKRRKSRSRSLERRRKRRQRRGSSSSHASEDEVEKLLRQERRNRRKNKDTSEVASLLPASMTVSPRPGSSAVDSPATDVPNGIPDIPIESGSWSLNKLEDVISKRVEAEVRKRAVEVEAELQRQIGVLREAIYREVRAELNEKYKLETEAIEKREVAEKARRAAAEEELSEKRREFESLRQQLDEERLEMLNQKRQTEIERNTLKSELENLKKKEQSVILNKSGAARTKLAFSLGSR